MKNNISICRYKTVDIFNLYSVRPSRLSRQFSRCGYDLAILALYPIGPRSRPWSPNGPRAIEQAECSFSQGRASLMAPENCEPNRIQFASQGFSLQLIRRTNRVNPRLFIGSRIIYRQCFATRREDISTIDSFGLD